MKFYLKFSQDQSELLQSDEPLDGYHEFDTEEEAVAFFEANKYITFPHSVWRVKEYPPITDYIDGVVKGDQAQIDAYIAACQAVKAKYPKV